MGSSRTTAISVIAFLQIGLFLLPTLAEAKIQRNREAIAVFKQSNPCPSNGKRSGPCFGWQIDHKTPLKCGGDDAPSNMHWMTIADHKAKTKQEYRWCRK